MPPNKADMKKLAMAWKRAGPELQAIRHGAPEGALRAEGRARHSSKTSGAHADRLTRQPPNIGGTALNRSRILRKKRRSQFFPSTAGRRRSINIIDAIGNRTSPAAGSGAGWAGALVVTE
jgi:hypothetical protein